MFAFLRLPARALILTLLALAACTKSGHPPGQTYRVDLNPPLKAGQKFSVVTDLSNTQLVKRTSTIPGLPAPQDEQQKMEIAAHIEADGEILAVFPNGSPQKVALTLKRITAVNNQAALPNLPASGAQVVLEKTGVSVTVTVNGQPADETVAKILRDALENGDANITNQTMFGPKSAVAVGDTWPVDPAAIMAAFQEGQGAVAAISGTMQLDAVTGTGENQVATVSGHIKMEGYKPPLPPEVIIDAAAYDLQVSGTIPAAAKGLKQLTTRTTMKLDAHGDQQGVQVRISIEGEEKKTSAITFP